MDGHKVLEPNLDHIPCCPACDIFLRCNFQQLRTVFVEEQQELDRRELLGAVAHIDHGLLGDRARDRLRSVHRVKDDGTKNWVIVPTLHGQLEAHDLIALSDYKL